ncbi:MAG: ROK family protein [Bacillaceae bacterium]|nr:ROK family protein [Bacillaceae bacterium]
MNLAIGIDIGGTKTAIGIVNKEGEVLCKRIIPTDQTVSPDVMVNRINESVQVLMKQLNVTTNDIKGVGVGAPGPIDTTRGEIVCPPNLPRWKGYKLVEQLSQVLNLDVKLENDASLAGLAEFKVGAAKNARDFLYVTISTGIGAGIIMDGKLVTGRTGNAGDIGHMVIDPSYGTCKCGQKGCFEWIASGTAIARQGTKLLNRVVTTEEVFCLYREGDIQIVKMVNDIFERIGMACVSLINIFDVNLIVLGGGVSKVGNPLTNHVSKYISKHALNPKGRKTKIKRSALSENVGIVGAATLFFLRL